MSFQLLLVVIFCNFTNSFFHLNNYYKQMPMFTILFLIDLIVYKKMHISIFFLWTVSVFLGNQLKLSCQWFFVIVYFRLTANVNYLNNSYKKISILTFCTWMGSIFFTELSKNVLPLTHCCHIFQNYKNCYSNSCLLVSFEKQKYFLGDRFCDISMKRGLKKVCKLKIQIKCYYCQIKKKWKVDFPK